MNSNITPRPIARCPLLTPPTGEMPTVAMIDIAWQRHQRRSPAHQQHPQQPRQPGIDRQQRARRGSACAPVRGPRALVRPTVCPVRPRAVTSNPPRFSGARMADAAIHIINPPIQPPARATRCSAVVSRAGSSNSVAPVVVTAMTISK